MNGDPPQEQGAWRMTPTIHLRNGMVGYGFVEIVTWTGLQENPSDMAWHELVRSAAFETTTRFWQKVQKIRNFCRATPQQICNRDKGFNLYRVSFCICRAPIKLLGKPDGEDDCCFLTKIWASVSSENRADSTKYCFDSVQRQKPRLSFCLGGGK